MFNKEIVFKGKHANLIQDMVINKQQKNKPGFFQRNLDVFLLAPIIGVYYNHTATEDKSANNTTKIFTEQLIKESLKIEFIYRIVMLLHNDKDSSEEKIKRAFQDDTNDERTKENMEIFLSYVLGGIEKIHEKLTEDAIDEVDYLNNLYDFVEQFAEDEVNEEELDIIGLAKG